MSVDRRAVPHRRIAGCDRLRSAASRWPRSLRSPPRRRAATSGRPWVRSRLPRPLATCSGRCLAARSVHWSGCARRSSSLDWCSRWRWGWFTGCIARRRRWSKRRCVPGRDGARATGALGVGIGVVLLAAFVRPVRRGIVHDPVAARSLGTLACSDDALPMIYGVALSVTYLAATVSAAVAGRLTQRRSATWLMRGVLILSAGATIPMLFATILVDVRGSARGAGGRGRSGPDPRLRGRRLGVLAGATRSGGEPDVERRHPRLGCQSVDGRRHHPGQPGASARPGRGDLSRDGRDSVRSRPGLARSAGDAHTGASG